MFSHFGALAAVTLAVFCVSASGSTPICKRIVVPGRGSVRLCVYSCPQYFWEGHTYYCLCNATVLRGTDQAQVGWTFRSDRPVERQKLHFRTTLIVRNARPELNNHTMACTWAWNGTSPRIEENITHVISYASGPEEGAVWIKATDNQEINGLTKVFFNCSWDATIMPRPPHVTWSGVSCLNGLNSPSCVFIPDPLVHDGKEIVCTVSSQANASVRNEASFNMSFVWTRKAVVTALTLYKVPLAGNETSKLFKLDCKAFGDPMPVVTVYKVPDKNGSSFGLSGTKQTAERSQRLGDYRWVKTYNVWPPDECGTIDTYRCDTSNENGHWSEAVTLLPDEDCVRNSDKADGLEVLYSLAAAPPSVFLLGLVVYVLHRRRRKKDWDDYQLLAPKTWKYGTEAEDARAALLYDAKILRDVTARRPRPDLLTQIPDVQVDKIEVESVQGSSEGDDPKRTKGAETEAERESSGRSVTSAESENLSAGES